jgi:hypothetical protein
MKNAARIVRGVATIWVGRSGLIAIAVAAALAAMVGEARAAFLVFGLVALGFRAKAGLVTRACCPTAPRR